MAASAWSVFGLVGAKTTFGVWLSLVVVLLAMAMLTVGWRLAVRKRYEAHRWTQTTAVCVNLVVVIFWMIRSLVLYVLPKIPAQLGHGSYGITTVHAVVAAVAVVLGVFVVLRGNELVPRAWRFKNYKRWMRTSYALYLVAALTGLGVFIVAYG